MVMDAAISSNSQTQMDHDDRKTLTGIAFPADASGRRSTLAAGRHVFSEALSAVSAQAADAIRQEADWRHRYMRHVRREVELELMHAGAAEAIARKGLHALHTHFEFHRGGQVQSLQAAMAQPGGTRLETVTIAGSGSGRPELGVPYRGELLRGDALRRQLDAWVAAGTVEPSFAAAINTVLDHPDWLDLSDWHIAVLGAGAELGPLPTLTGWRANLAVVDTPESPAWGRIVATARKSNGRVLLPLSEHTTVDDPTLAFKAGADLLTETPEIRDWLAELPRPLAVGGYAYLDGEAHVRVSLAMDAIMASLIEQRADVVPAWLLNPTDVFAVPAAAAEAAMRAWRERGSLAWLQAPLRWASGGRLFRPNVSELITGYGGLRAGIVDSIVPQQGSNSVMARRLQKWRAVATQVQGRAVSANVAPATNTRSTLKNKALAAAYKGAYHFGVEIFEPATANALMAALLVYDLRRGNTGMAGRHPAELFMENAAHGGLWRIAYEPRSALPFAAVLGLF